MKLDPKSARATVVVTGLCIMAGSLPLARYAITSTAHPSIYLGVLSLVVALVSAGVGYVGWGLYMMSDHYQRSLRKHTKAPTVPVEKTEPGPRQNGELKMSHKDERELTSGESTFAFFAAILADLVYAAVLRVVWAWFVTPTFHKPVPPFWMTVGLMLFVDLMFTAASATPTTPINKLYFDRLMMKCFASPLLLLSLAYVVHLLAS